MIHAVRIYFTSTMEGERKTAMIENPNTPEPNQDFEYETVDERREHLDGVYYSEATSHDLPNFFDFSFIGKGIKRFFRKIFSK
jgi:hypothetical protein